MTDQALHTITTIIFINTYAGVAIGEIPGLALDRTGIAILGAIAMVASGVISPEVAVKSIDIPTILLLYSLMVLSSQFRIGGFYTWVATRVARLSNRPIRFFFMMMLVSTALSAILSNDIICLAFTPVTLYLLLRLDLILCPIL